MSFRTLRCILSGTLVTAILSLGGPVSGEAAGFFEASETPVFWVRAWHWLAAQISPAEAEMAVPAEENHSTQDAGWVIDPDG